MTAFVGLLRAVNLAGHNKVGMADLRALLSGLGLTDVQSLLQTGNLIFRSRTRSAGELERLLESASVKRLALDTDFFVRTAKEWASVIEDNPFPKEAKRDPSHLVVVLLKEAADPDRAKALTRAITGPEMVRANGRCLYIVYPDGIGRSRLTSTLIEGKLETRGTARNWNTVLKLGALVSAAASVVD